MKKTATLCVLGLLVMAAAFSFAVAQADLRKEWAAFGSLTWSWVVLIDYYLGQLFIAAWVIFRGRAAPGALLWAGLIVALGNFFTCLYVFGAVRGSGGDWARLLLGERVFAGR